MINSMVDNHRSDKENAVHSVTDQSKINSSDRKLTDGNSPKISEDRKPTLPLLSMAQMNNVSDPVPNSKATPDNKDWFLYRPRTRSAKKKLSLSEVILISSDSEGSDVECSRNPYVMEIVPKTEIFSDDSVLDGVVTPDMIVTDNSESLECQSPSSSGEAHQSSVSPLKALTAVNTSPLVKMRQDSQSNCSNDNDSTVNYNQGVKDEPYDSDSSETNERNESKQKAITGSSTEKDMISDIAPLEEAVVSHVIDTDNSELLEQQTIVTNSCVETLQPSASPSPVKLLLNTSPSVQDPQSNCCNDNNSSEPVADYINSQPVADSINQIINPADGLNNEDNCSEAVRDKSYDTESIIDDESQLNIAVMNEGTISDVATLEEAHVVTDNSELLAQQPIGAGECDKSQQPSVSPVEVLRAVKTSLLVEIRQDTHSNCFNVSAEPVTDDISQIISSSGDLNNDDNCSQALKEEPYETRSTEAIVDDESKRDITTETATKEEKVLNVPLLEETVVSHVIITKITDVHEQKAIGTDSSVVVDEPSLSPIKVSTGPLVEERQDSPSSCSNDNDSSEAVTDDNSQAKQNIISCADLSNENDEAAKDSIYNIGTTEPVIDSVCDSKENIIGTECNSNNGFRQNIEPNISENESPKLMVYGIKQTKQKTFLCECSTCSKCEKAIGNDQAEMVQEMICKLRPKCLQFELDSESELNESMVQAVDGNRSSTPLIADSPQSSAEDASDLEDSTSVRLEWSSDHDELMIDEGPEVGSNPNDSDENMHSAEQKNDFLSCKGEHDEGLTEIDDSKQNVVGTEVSNAVYLSDDELLQKLSQQTERKSNFDSRSLSDDDLVARGRYGQEVTNDAVNFLIILPNSGVPRMNSMDERKLSLNDVPVPVPQNKDVSPVEDHSLPSSVSSKSQDDNMEESNSGCSEYEQENDQRPAEKEDKLLMRLKRRWSAGSSKNFDEIPQKRTHIETSSESDSDGQQIEQNKRPRRKPKKSSLQLAERMGGFFRKMSNSLRANGTKMKAKLSLGRRSLPNRRETGTDHFVVTPYREDKVVESMKGFVVIPDRQDIETEDDS
ncbi:hypothetical protein HA402_015548 [Bradysia odoriphaga]|nr:hypothetical protein HA402_015548 [Bradysia odoriphaga]